jgi:redox-sensing transcriptional repressor
MQLNETKIPQATILRLSIYYRYLQSIISQGIDVVSSNELAQQTNVNPAQLRKDLSYFGKFGVRGVGYDIPKLLNNLKNILGLNKERKMALVGLGHIGLALIQDKCFERGGYKFDVVFDLEENNVGKNIEIFQVYSLDELSEAINEKGIEFGVIAVENEMAQNVADAFVKAGLKGILNFSSVRLNVPDDVHVRYADFTVLLDTLTFSISKREFAEKEISFKGLSMPYSRISTAWGVA